jgi:hypothetical protein
VRNITVHRHDTVSGSIGRVKPLPLLSESIWIFHVANEGVHTTAVDIESRTSGFRPWINTTRHSVVAMLDSVFARVREEIVSGAQVILVGLDALPHLSGDGEPCISAITLAKFALRGLYNCVEVFSLDEYRACVGPERAALETVMQVE